VELADALSGCTCVPAEIALLAHFKFPLVPLLFLQFS